MQTLKSSEEGQAMFDISFSATYVELTPRSEYFGESLADSILLTPTEARELARMLTLVAEGEEE